ncbi:hypothetical protein [Deinococcus sp. Leaf326]|uniref:hypothetical protein n=1 Tax=Deinococcus sp. Leaf326 TaxID=1736338 RepID=UPI0006F3483B|nr:hypothetical protein [Deinococcus sp. Leaf326]KQR08699.1 hypothetical protein ASF71_09170 [Deinococcus sp. Leaf326]
MAPHVTTVLTVARAGAGVVRYLIRPARHPVLDLSATGRDPWLEARPQARLRRGANVARRGLGLVMLLVLALLGASVVGTVAVLLGIGAAAGSTVAGWLLGFTLLLGLLGTFWTGRRALNLLRATEDLPAGADRAAALPAGADEAGLLQLLRQHEGALGAPARSAFHRTVVATRDALRLAENEPTLSRDTYDVQQAAREDLPELMAAYRAVPPSRASDEQLLEQLGLIEARVQEVGSRRAAQRRRMLGAHGAYLRGKYEGEPEE